MTAKQFPCSRCGAKVEFVPGTAELECPHCGHRNAIPQSDDDIAELDFRTHLEELAEGEETIEQQTVDCARCGGSTTLDPNVTAGRCVFCGTDIVATAKSAKLIKPKAVLPFAIDEFAARKEFRTWVEGLWFAPNALVRHARTQASLKGIYVPYWTYDADTTTHYSGLRGDAYYVTQTYTVMVNGRPSVRTRQVRHIRWTPVSGVVWGGFNDVLVLASDSLPRKHTLKLEPWDLGNLVPYADEYLSGFGAESYRLGLVEGFEVAKEVMDGRIRADVLQDIGGDEQQIATLRTRHDNVTFKHVLLPIWVSAYRFRERVFRFLVNGRTGEVQGERPWSGWKITFAVLAALAVIATIVLAFAN